MDYSEITEQYKSFGFNIVGSQPFTMTGGNANKQYYVNQMIGFLDNCSEWGLKGIVYDNRLGSLVKYCDPNVDISINDTKTELVGSGENALFATQAEFESYVATLIADYKDHSAFGGIFICDEPTAAQFDRYAAVVNAIRKVIPDVYIHCLLLPISATTSLLTDDTTLSREDAYKDYLNSFVEKVGLDYIMFDSYPFLTDKLQNEHINGVKIAAEICEENDLRLLAYVQTFARYIAETDKYYERQVFVQDIYWQINMLLGFGADGVGYYMYSDKGNGHNVLGSTLVDSDGNVTELGESVKNINAEIIEFSKFLSYFDYSKSASFGAELDHVTISDDVLTKATVDSVSGTALVTELYDELRGDYIYMVQNVSDPTGSNGTELKLNINFSGCETVTIFVNGVATEMQLDNGTLNVEIPVAGDAIFIYLQ